MSGVELRDHFSRISAARRAAAELRGFAASCKLATLRDESNAVAEEAVQLLSEFEAKALHPECNLLPETIGKAALKAEDALKVLQGKVATAVRESKGRWFSQLGKQLVNPHKKIFKDARDGLALARAAMAREEVDALTSDEEEDPYQQAQQQQQQQLATQLGTPELHLSWERGVRVSCVALTPHQDGSATLLVGLNRKVELYPGCSSVAKTEVSLSDKAQVVTCVAYDTTTLNVWTGCADGSVLLHARGRWGFASLPTSVGLPVRAMAVDNRHFCWVGDEAGIIRVVTLDPNTDRLSARMQLIPPQAHTLVRLAAQGPAAAAAAAAAPAACGPLGAAGKCVPVYAMLCRGPAMFASGSKALHSITVYNNQTYQELEVANCESFGATYCFAVLPWEADEAEQQGAAAPAGQPLSFVQRAVPGIPATGIALGYAAAPVPRATVPPSVMAAAAANAGARATQLAGTPPDAADTQSSWRLLTGHERGQVLLWQFKGVQRSHASARTLHLLCVIGEAKPQCSVRGMAVFEDLSMLVLVLSTGGLAALPMPTAHNGAVAAAGRASSFAAVGVPASHTLPLGGTGLPSGPGTPALHMWLPRTAQIKAHKNGIEAASSLGELLITASSATVKYWTADRLKVEAQGYGLMFSRQSSVFSGAPPTPAALQAALAGDAASATGNSRREPQQMAAAAAAAVAAAAAAGYSDDESTCGTSSSTTGPYVLPLQDTQPMASSPTAPAAAAAGGFIARVANSSSASSVNGALPQPASSTSSTRPPPASCTASNPMSRAGAAQRGLQVDAKGTVIVQPKVDPMRQWSSGPGVSVPAFSSAGPMPMIHAVGLPGPGPALMQYPPQLPPGTAPVSNSLAAGQSQAASASVSNSGLEPSNSVQTGEGIKLYHVICNSELVLKEVIGSGAEGKVYRGMWTNIDIAAKEYLAVDDCDIAEGKDAQPSEAAMQRARDALRKEVALLTSLNHPNLVRFCGVCLDPPLVVMEYYRHGNVYSMLEKARRQWCNLSAKAQHSRQATKYMNYFNWDRRLEMLHDVAAGMMYLHKRHYVHGDLRSPNLFVGLDGRVKIGDFGFTKRLSGNKASMQVKRITHPRWVAPELMTRNRLSTASDVYSYAIIMYEMLTWQMPFHDLSKEQVVLRVMSGGRPEMPSEEELPPGTSSSTCLGNYMKLMAECWDQEPDKRPSFDKIAARLKAMIRWRLVINKCRLQSSTMLAFASSKGGSTKAAAAGSAAAATQRRANGVPPAPAGAAAAEAGAGAAALVKAGMRPVAAPAGRGGAAAVAATAAEGDGHDHDHDPLPRPLHPIATAATADGSDLPLLLPEGLAAGGPIIMNLSPTLSARVLEQPGVAARAAAAADSSTLEASAFGVPPAAAGLPAPAAVAAAVAAKQAGAAVVAVPGGGCVVVGSDVPSGSPRSCSTLSTRNSTDAGLSTGGLSTPPASLTWEGQVAKPADASKASQQQQQQQQQSSPPGYPTPFQHQGSGFSSGLVPAGQQAAARSVPAAVAADASSADVGGFVTAAGAAAAAAALAAAGGAVDAGVAAGRGGSELLAGTSKSAKLGRIQESSEATVSSKDSKQMQQQLLRHAAGDSSGSTGSVSSVPAGQPCVPGLRGVSGASSTDHAAMALAMVGPLELSQQELQGMSSGDTSSRVAGGLTSQRDAQPPAAAAACTPAAHGTSGAAAAATAAAEADVGEMYGAFAAQQQRQQQLQDIDDVHGAFATQQFVQEQQQQQREEAADDLGEMYGAFALQQQRRQQEQQEREPEPDVFLAQDSPFFISPGVVPASTSVDMGPLFAAAAAPPAAGGASSSTAAVGAAAGSGSSAAVPAYLDADYLDDSCLQPLDDDGPGLGVAITLVYQEGLTPAEAANQDSYTIKSNSFSGCTLPSLEAGMASNSAGNGSNCGDGIRPAGGAYPASRPDSYAVDAGPFAALNLTADLCDSRAPASNAGGALPVSMGDSPFAAAGGIGVAGSIAPPSAAQGPGAGPGQFGDGSFEHSPFAAPPAAAGLGVAGMAGGLSGPRPIATAAGARQPSLGLPAGSPQQHSPSGLAGQPPAGGVAELAVGWIQTLGLATARRPQRAAAGQVQADYMTGGQAPAVPDAAGDGRRVSTSSRTSSCTATTGGPISTQSSMAGGGTAADAACGAAAGVGSPARAGGAPTAVAAAPPDSLASGPHFTQPLDDRCLNKPLGTAKEEEDLVTKAERDLRAWESRTSDKGGKLRRTSGATGSRPTSSNSSDPSNTALTAVLNSQEQPQLQQQMATDCSLPSPFAAAGGAGSGTLYSPGDAAAAPAGWPPAGMLPGGAMAPAVSAVASGPGGYPMAGPVAATYNIVRSTSSFDQVAPGERVTVVNRPFNPAAVGMDGGGIPSSAAGTSMPMHLHSGWGGVGVSGRTVSGPPSMMYGAGGVPAGGLAAVQHAMVLQAQQQHQGVAMHMQQQGIQQAMQQGMQVPGGDSHSSSFAPNWGHACLGSGEAPALPQDAVDSMLANHRMLLLQPHQQQLQQQQQRQPVYGPSPGLTQAQQLRGTPQQLGYYLQQHQQRR